jgi:hypothetical protein
VERRRRKKKGKAAAAAKYQILLLFLQSGVATAVRNGRSWRLETEEVVAPKKRFLCPAYVDGASLHSNRYH